jgi:hypothetical protein
VPTPANEPAALLSFPKTLENDESDAKAVDEVAVGPPKRFDPPKTF